MAAEESEHTQLIHRWLAGEVVNNHVGIKVVGGPSNGRTKIMKLGPGGTPPAQFRTSGGRAGSDWHLYQAVRSTDVPVGWIYSHIGIAPAPTD
ncbi:hypothetical protein ACIP8U_18635 [Streptomyces pseudovenezuelae]|uniref:hypothetical protein n=1 Tax=Streptomyces pseudovenezuelae TaxID=67350 RepID=UPI0036E1E20D